MRFANYPALLDIRRYRELLHAVRHDRAEHGLVNLAAMSSLDYARKIIPIEGEGAQIKMLAEFRKREREAADALAMLERGQAREGQPGMRAKLASIAGTWRAACDRLNAAIDLYKAESGQASQSNRRRAA